MRSEIPCLFQKSKLFSIQSTCSFTREVKVLQSHITFISLHDRKCSGGESKRGQTDMCTWRFSPEILPKSVHDWNREREREKEKENGGDFNQSWPFLSPPFQIIRFHCAVFPSVLTETNEYKTTYESDRQEINKLSVYKNGSCGDIKACNRRRFDEGTKGVVRGVKKKVGRSQNKRKDRCGVLGRRFPSIPLSLEE